MPYKNNPNQTSYYNRNNLSHQELQRQNYFQSNSYPLTSTTSRYNNEIQQQYFRSVSDQQNDKNIRKPTTEQYFYNSKYKN